MNQRPANIRRRRLRDRLRYMVDRAFTREFMAQLALFLLLITVVTVIGMTAIFFGLFAPENEHVEAIPRGIDRGYFDALWWSVNHVLSLPEFERMYGASAEVLIYSFLLSLMGVATFGILISLINNSIRNRVEALKRGDTPVIETDHVLILGWSQVNVAVLRQFAQLSPGSRVVILAPMDIEEMRERLRIAGISDLPLTVVLRSGTTSNKAELDRVAVAYARCILILATCNDDSATIKTLVQLASRKAWFRECPMIAAEIRDDNNSEIALIASRRRAHIASTSTLISRVIVQAIRNPGLSSVFEEFCSMNGNNFYVQAVDKASNELVSDLAHQFPDAIPIGISWDKEQAGETQQAIALNPEPDYDIAEDDRIVFIASQAQIRHRASSFTPHISVVDKPARAPNVPDRILLIGWNHLVTETMRQIDHHAVGGTRLMIITRMQEETVQEKLSKEAEFENLSYEVLQGDPAAGDVYKSVNLESFGCIVVLASAAEGVADPDTQSLRVLLRLRDTMHYQKHKPHTVVELMDDVNRELFTDLGVGDIVVGTEIVSASLSQVAQEPILRPVYRELLSVGGVELSFRPLSDYLEMGVRYRFDDLIHAAQDKLEIAVGIRRAEDSQVMLNPDRQSSWTVGEKDQVVVLAQQIYR